MLVALAKVLLPLVHFAFIAQACAMVGAPKPTVVHVDGAVNASSGFHRGWVSLFRGDVDLAVGLPLAVASSQHQCAGVLAREFGHFAQGAGMRLT